MFIAVFLEYINMKLKNRSNSYYIYIIIDIIIKNYNNIAFKQNNI